MSLESALDEERREVMAILEGNTPVARTGGRDHGARLRRAASPAGVAQSPVRSMLDVGDLPAAPRHASIGSPTSGSIGSPRSPGFPPAVRSLLNTDSPPLTPASTSNLHHARTVSGPGPSDPDSPAQNLEDAYQFEIPPRQPGKKKGALASVFGSSSSEPQRARHNSTSGTIGGRRPMSPSSRLGGHGRSMSPAQTSLSATNYHLMADPGKYIAPSGKVIDISSAYRRLSDANLIRSGGNLANLPTRKGSDPEKGESRAPDGGVRLEKDYFADDDIDDEDEEAVDDSEEDADDEDGWRSGRQRGRQRLRANSEDKESSASPAPRGSKKSQGSLGTGDEERECDRST